MCSWIVGPVAAGCTVRVKLWMAIGPTKLVASMVMGNTPLVVAVPDSRPADERVTPVGSAPDSVKVGAGKPEAVTVKLPAVPSVKVARSAEVMVGCASTVRVKVWVALGVTPLAAVMVIGKVPLAVAGPRQQAARTKG